MSRKPDPICSRLPPDLDAAVRDRAMAEGLSPSEMLRLIVQQWAYGSMATADEGYFQARQLAQHLAHVVLQAAINQLPQTYEEAMAIIKQYPLGSPLPIPH